MTAVKIQLENFQGPYDLLLSLLDSQKLEITEISISKIADQYIDYISLDGGFNLDVASEFILMAATLIHMKSRFLLPKVQDEEEELSPDELARRLALYKAIKEVSLHIDDSMSIWQNAMYKEPEKLDFPVREEILDLNIFELSNCWTILQQTLLARRSDPSEKMQRILEKEKINLKDKMIEVVNMVLKKTRTKFSDIFSLARNSRAEVVTGFLAILELGKSRKINIEQEALFAEININKNEELDYTDLDEYFNNYNDVEF